MSDLAKKVREMRQRRAMSCAELDRAAGLSIGHTARIERGVKGVTSTTLDKLAAALGVSSGWLLK